MERPKYEIDIFWSEEDDGYIANVPDLKYCSAFGETYEEALREVRIAMDLHLDVLKEMGRPIPEPRFASQEEARTLPKVETPQPPGLTAQRTNEAGKKFAEAVGDLYKTMMIEPLVWDQLPNNELWESFFNSLVDNLRAQAESNREMAQQLISHEEALAQESAHDYIDFIQAILLDYRERVSDVDRSAGEFER